MNKSQQISKQVSDIKYRETKRKIKFSLNFINFPIKSKNSKTNKNNKD